MYWFEPVVAKDSDSDAIAYGASGQVYDITDTAFANPLTVTLLSGVPTDTLSVGALGVTPEFGHETKRILVFKSGAFEFLMVSISAMDADITALDGRVTDIEQVLETGVPGTSGVDDSGMAELIADTNSATSEALVEKYGPGQVVLDLDDPRPPGFPVGGVIYRVAGGGTPPPVATVYAKDDFEGRTVATTPAPGGWGTSTSGGAWAPNLSLVGTWSVASGRAVYSSGAAGSRLGGIRLTQYSQSTVEVVGKIARHSGATGSLIAQIAGRRDATNVGHFASIHMRSHGSSRPFQIDASLDTPTGGLGSLASTVGGVLTTSAYDQIICFKIQFIQEDAGTTRVRLRLWLDGNAEPATWAREATDTTPANQHAGELYIQFLQSSGETVTSEAYLYEVEARSII